jgi:mannosyltransferase OCH1-like enzyme
MTEIEKHIFTTITNEDLIKITVPEYVTKDRKEMQTLFLKNEFNTTHEDADQNMRKLRERACLLIQDTSLPDDFIKITHKVWVTNPDNKYEPSMECQELVKQQYLNLPHYRHIFWTNVPDFCKNFIESWGINSEINIEIRDIIEFKDYYGYRVFKAYMNQQLFANACDILKIQVVCKYGGIFSDIGWSLKPTLDKIIKNFNIVINGEFIEPGIVSHNILGSKIVEHYLYMSILKIIDNIDKNKQYYNSIKSVWGIIELSSPRMLTAAVSSICKDDNILLIVNNEYTTERYHNHSWFGEGKYGVRLQNNIYYKKFEYDLKIV